MSWTLRHEGSPKVIEGLTAQQVADGLAEGMWAGTDEVRGPTDSDWQVIENHPQFAELAMDLDLPVGHPPEDETRLDMNPLIDVCLVLLIFFMITATYSTLQKYFDSPKISEKSTKPKAFTKQQLKETAIKVTARMEKGKPVIEVEDQAVNENDLVRAITGWASKDAKKNSVWIQLARDVPYGVGVDIRVAIAKAKIDKVMLVTEPTPQPAPKPDAEKALRKD